MLPRSFRTCKVLYVEDEPLIAMDGEGMLRDIGFDDIQVAMTLADALAILKSNRFDIAVMDINLGSGDTSLPLAEVLSARGTPIVFTSGYNSSPNDGITRYGPRIEKPFDETTLYKAVMSVADRIGALDTAVACTAAQPGAAATPALAAFRQP